MSDSVDRVFSHALNTVNKIRTGADKPPAATRLTLYGLYKQSMEGNVEGIMIRPTGKDEESQRSREKWDAWKSCSGLSRTEAKRRYITTLIETMRKYASTLPDSRELVDELEFVWDQVKSNVSSSNSSSPVHHNQGLGITSPSTEQSPPPPAPAFSFLNRSMKRVGGAPAAGTRTSQDLRILTSSPLSQSAVDDNSDGDDDGEEFVDAPDSQLATTAPAPHPTFSDDNKSTTSQPQPNPPHPPDDNTKPVEKSTSAPKKHSAGSDSRWRKRIESALVKMTAEVAALREQLEARSWATARTRRAQLEQWGWAIFSFVAKMVAVDLVLLVLLLLWLRRKRDGRLEGAIRVLLGDAVAQVQRVGSGVQRQAQKSVGRVTKIALAAGVKKSGGPGGSGPGA